MLLYLFLKHACYMYITRNPDSHACLRYQQLVICVKLDINVCIPITELIPLLVDY